MTARPPATASRIRPRDHGSLSGGRRRVAAGTAGVSTRCAQPPRRYGPSSVSRLRWQLWALRPGLDGGVPGVHDDSPDAAAGQDSGGCQRTEPAVPGVAIGVGAAGQFPCWLPFPTCQAAERTAPAEIAAGACSPRACSRSAVARSPPPVDLVNIPGRPAAEQPVDRASGMENAHEHCGNV